MINLDKFLEINNKIYLVEPSDKKNKKYDVFLVSFSKLNKHIPQNWKKYTMDGLKENDIVKKYILSFGQKGMEQYKDKFGFYKDLDHNDKKRRDAYRSRHKNDNIDNPDYAGYWSWNYLW